MLSNEQLNNLTIFKSPKLLEKDNEYEDMKNITKRSDGRWMGRKTINGKRVAVYGRTQKECYRKWKALKETKKDAPIYPTNFERFSMYWFETFKKREIAASSHNFYLSTIKNYLSRINKNIDQITTNDLQELLNDMPPARTKEKAYMTIKQIFRKAKELNIIKSDVSEYITKGKIEKEDVPAFSLEEQARILSNIKDNDISAIILTYLLTGCRPAEIKSLRKSKLKPNSIYINGTKTKNAKRWVKISNKLYELLSKRSEVIFDISQDSIYRQIKDFFAEVGIEGGTVYRLRHTFATNLYYLQVPDKERAVYMGHYSSVLTNDIYTDFDPNIKKQDILNLYRDLYPDF